MCTTRLSCFAVGEGFDRDRLRNLLLAGGERGYFCTYALTAYILMTCGATVFVRVRVSIRRHDDKYASDP